MGTCESLERWGWSSYFEALWNEGEREATLPARVIAQQRKFWRIAGAFGVGRLLQTVLVQAGTSARDPVTIVSIAALMIVVSVNACFWPARRATRLDPVSALRYE